MGYEAIDASGGAQLKRQGKLLGVLPAGYRKENGDIIEDPITGPIVRESAAKSCRSTPRKRAAGPQSASITAPATAASVWQGSRTTSAKPHGFGLLNLRQPCAKSLLAAYPMPTSMQHSAMGYAWDCR